MTLENVDAIVMSLSLNACTCTNVCLSCEGEFGLDIVFQRERERDCMRVRMRVRKGEEKEE